ncbi:MAG: TonB-dependent receptor [Acidobacteriaceae bacterium]|nr:TonB-dependent receptor [Acidobacteriaceae bacterium]
MQSCYRFFAVLFLSISALASQLNVRVVDPQSAAVAGAQVEIFSENSNHSLGIQITSAQGIAQFHAIAASSVRIHVLAPGFAERWSTVSAAEAGNGITINLQLAVAAETVVVSATRTPLPTEESGAAIDSLSGAVLETTRPVAANDALRFLPGAIVSTAGQRGGLASLFVDGGESRYNKVIVDGVPINDPGGTFDFGTLPLFEADRMEFLRGAQSTLYGSDAMSSVVQIWSRTGSTPVPEFRFGADAGNYGTENGYAALAGANGRFDYNLFGNQFNTTGSGPNDDYSNSLEGANLGAKLNDSATLRLRMRHDNSVSGVQNEWNFNGQKLLPPDLDQRARQNNFLGSLELNISGPSRLQQRIQGFDYTLHRTNIDSIDQGNRIVVLSPSIAIDEDFQFHNVNNYNRAGLNYQANYVERSWTLSTAGYEFEDENGVTGNLPFPSHGLRRNHAVFGEQLFTFERLSFIGGGRFVHNQSFGNKFVPRLSLNVLALKGGQLFSGTRLRFSYATGIEEPTFAESFGSGGGFPTIPNPFLRPEETRAFQAGFEQRLRGNYSFSATYFNNLFRNQIDFNFDPCFCKGQYVNINESMAHGAEVELHARPRSRVSVDASYSYTSTQILKEPLAFDPILSAGRPLLRRPKHSATLMTSYLGPRWGANLSGSFVGRRADSDFFGYNFNHTPGYVLVNAGGWYNMTPRITTYVNVENVLNRFYEEVIGYPALGANFRAGMRFRIGGE